MSFFGHRIDITYVGIEKEDYLFASSITDVDSGFNLLTEEGQKDFISKVEIVSGQKVKVLKANVTPAYVA